MHIVYAENMICVCATKRVQQNALLIQTKLEKKTSIPTYYDYYECNIFVDKNIEHKREKRITMEPNYDI